MIDEQFGFFFYPKRKKNPLSLIMLLSQLTSTEYYPTPYKIRKQGEYTRQWSIGRVQLLPKKG